MTLDLRRDIADIFASKAEDKGSVARFAGALRNCLKRDLFYGYNIVSGTTIDGEEIIIPAIECGPLYSGYDDGLRVVGFELSTKTLMVENKVVSEGKCLPTYTLMNIVCCGDGANPVATLYAQQVIDGINSGAKCIVAQTTADDLAKGGTSAVLDAVKVLCNRMLFENGFPLERLRKRDLNGSRVVTLPGVFANP